MWKTKETQLVYVTGTMEWLLNYGAKLEHYHELRQENYCKIVLSQRPMGIFNLQRHLVPIGRILVLILPSCRCTLTVQRARLKPFQI